MQNLAQAPNGQTMVYAAQPREGTETLLQIADVAVVHTRFMQLNPARGRKRVYNCPDSDLMLSWFMQLNPARGRKHGL